MTNLTIGSLHTSRNSTIVILRLLRKSSSSRRQAAKPNINLRLMYDQTLIGECLHGGHLRRRAGS